MIHAVCYETGERLTLEGKHPRKELLAQLGVKSAQKMYRDKLNPPRTVQTGYVAGGRWWEFFTVEPWERPA